MTAKDAWAMRESRYTDDEFEGLCDEFRVAAGGSPGTPFVPAELYLYTSDDPRWEDPLYSKASHDSDAMEGELEC